MPAYLLVPKKLLDGKAQAPAILSLHPTHKLGFKTTVGLAQYPDEIVFAVDHRQDADVVLFIFREEYYHQMRKPTEANRDKFAEWLAEGERVDGKAEVIIGKQRHGPTGTIQLQFKADVTRFSNLAREDHLPERI